jgi:beta-glucosidase
MVQSVLWRLQHGQLDGIDPKLVVLMIGTNNLQFDPPEKIAHGIQVLVDEYLKDAPHANLLLLGIFPRGTLSSDPFRPKIAEVNQQIASLADGKRVVYLDIGTTFLASDGSLRPEMFAADRIHPNDKLYEAWADVMQPEIGKLLGLPDSPNGAGVSPATSK